MGPENDFLIGSDAYHGQYTKRHSDACDRSERIGVVSGWA
jgi:hypothetical protein